jgi:hypothetical protein
MVTEDRSGFTDAERKEERSPLWAQCDACSQWTTVEEDVAWPPSSGKWKCKMNTWNPGLAKCVTQVEFYEQYRAFVLKRNEDHLLRKVACIHGRPVDLWHLYNLVTQLGGWNTIYTNRWQSLLYCDKPEWAHHTDIGNRLKVIYTKYLLPYEEAHFKGKRYSVPEESNKLFVPLSRQAQQGYTTSCLKGDKRDRYAVNTRVWAQVGNGDWWPGKIIADDSTPMQTSSTSDGHRGNKRPVVVQLYNFEGKRHAVFTLERRSVEAFLPNSRPHVSEALKRAVEAALNDADATPLINEPNAVDGDDQDSAEDTSSQGVSSEATESSDPKSEVAAQPEPKPRGRPRGRPRKNDSQPKPTGRPRGRPPKNPQLQALRAAEAAQRLSTHSALIPKLEATPPRTPPRPTAPVSLESAAWSSGPLASWRVQ